MTKPLQKAFRKASELREIEQDSLARRLPGERESDRERDRLFAESPDVLDRLAQEAPEAQRAREHERD